MRAVLHIGTEKTATTTIQDFVYHNRAQLLSEGIALSDELLFPNNRKLPSFCFLPDQYDDFFSGRGISTREGKEAFFTDFEDRFKKEVKRLSAKADVMFITSEHFHSRLKHVESVRILKKFLDGIFSEVQIVCYFREQSQLVKSLYSTAVKVGSSIKLQKFSEECDPEQIYYNYLDLCNMWCSVFGKENFTARLFSKTQFQDGDIRKDVLSLIKPQIDLTAFDYEITDSNISLGQVGIELGRINNRINKRITPSSQQSRLRGNIMRVIQNSSIAKTGVLPFPEAPVIFASFMPSNIAFAEKYLNIKENPFTAPHQQEENTADTAVSLDTLLDFMESLIKAVKKNALNEDDFATDLRDLAIKLENHKDFTLSDAKMLMEVAGIMRPHGPKIKQKLLEYEERSKNAE